MATKNVRTTEGYDLINTAPSGGNAEGTPGTDLVVPANASSVRFDNSTAGGTPVSVTLPNASQYFGAPALPLALTGGAGDEITVVAAAGNTVSGDVGPFGAGGVLVQAVATSRTEWELTQLA